jgi:hypothetical protein
MRKQTPVGMTGAAFMTKRYEFFYAGLMQHKARRPRLGRTLMAAAEDSHGALAMAG